MRALLGTLALLLSGCGALTACGSSGERPVPTPARASRATSTYNGPSTVDPGKALPMSGYEPPTKLRFLKGDEDRDSGMWDDGYRKPDNDEDSRLDHTHSDIRDANEGYRDADDLDSLRVGVPASLADAKTIAGVVKRYYAVAVTGNGAKACTMMARSFVRSVPLDYGKFGAPYLHGGKTCADIASREFAHSHRTITAAVYITAVHLEHPDRAYALFGSRTGPASFITVVREGGVWKIGALLGRAMP